MVPLQDGEMSPFMGTVKSALIEDSARAGHTEPKSRHVVPW